MSATAAAAAPMLAGPDAAVTAARALAPAFAARAERYDREGAFPVEDFADIRAAGLLGVMVPARLGGAGAGFADYAEVAMAMAAGNGATALVFNMHASVTGALAGTPEDLARALGVPESFFDMRDRVLAAAAAGAHYAVAMSERGPVPSSPNWPPATNPRAMAGASGAPRPSARERGTLMPTWLQPARSTASG